jgi:hypothetical protein
VPLILQLPTSNFQLPNNYWWGFAVAALVMSSVWILYRIDRHMSSAAECFHVAVLLGIASYWVPTVVFMTVPFWIFIIYQNAFNVRSVLATLLGYCLVAVYAALGVWLGWIACPWAYFFSVDYLWGWIPTASLLTAWLASTIVRQSLRER